MNFSNISPVRLQKVARATSRARTIITYLHIPKSGGSTFRKSMQKSRRWLVFNFDSAPTLNACECGKRACVKRARGQTAWFAPLHKTSSNIVLYFGHTDILSVNAVREQIHEMGGKTGPLIVSYRSTSDRIASAFRDYWTQVSIATNRSAAESSHGFRKAQKYRDDSRHYTRPDNSIRHDLWWDAFGKFGPGVPFWLSDIFGTPSTISVTASSHVKFLPILCMNTWLSETLKVEVVQERISNKSEERVETALLESSARIRELALRDSDFENEINYFLAKPLPDFK